MGEKMKCLVNKPYPKIRVEKKSLETAKILSHLYASNESEMTAINQYIYETLVLENKEIASIIRDIAIVEMHHLEILGKLINCLGCMPIYADCNYNETNYWNSDYVYYDTDLKTILDINIEAETKAIYNYQMVLNVIEDIYVKENIKRIIEDEYLHLEIFEKLKENL